MKAVIIGGGIAGLTAGILLHRKGLEVTVCEREVDIPSRGNAFLMHAEADTILKRLTLDFQPGKIPGKLINSFCLRRPDNHIVKFQKLDPWHCITRKAIIELLYGMVPPGMKVLHGRKFSRFEFQSERAVSAVFETGEEISGDLFIGADGSSSEVRQQIFGPTAFTQMEVREILGTVYAPELNAALSNTFTKFQSNEMGLSFGLLPTSADSIVWYMQFDCRNENPAGTEPHQLKEFCLQALKDFPPLVQDTVTMDPFDNSYIWNTRDFDLLPSFHRNNVVLAGDAAHLSLPFTSAGTTNAFVDGATLADLISGREDQADLNDLFTAYYDARAGRIASQVQLGRDLKRAFLFPKQVDADAILIPLAGRPQLRHAPAAPPIRIYYFTDPICSTCWASQPQLRKLQLEYGEFLQVEYRMGGLLPSWENFNRGGITSPSEVASHWEEVCAFYEMPINKEIWLEDPLPSSYPPSIAFKAAQLQDTGKAIVFLRRIREMLFLEKKNIIKPEFLSAAAYDVGLDTIRLIRDLEGPATELFRADLKLVSELEVKVLPTLYFSGENGEVMRLEGFQPYSAYEEMVRHILPQVRKTEYDRSPEFLFGEFQTLTLKEFSFLRDEPESDAHHILKELSGRNLIRKFESQAGNIWMSNFNSLEMFE